MQNNVLPEKRRVYSVDEMKIEVDGMSSMLNELRNEIIRFKEIPQFLEVFSYEDIEKMNLEEREIAKNLQKITEIKRAIRSGYIELLTDESISEMFSETKERVIGLWIFIERMKSKVYAMNVTLDQFIFYPISTTIFFIGRYRYRRMTDGLQAADE